jgi:transaldolase
MRKGGVTNYREFAIEAIEAAEGKPLSLEVVSDDLETMTTQGLLLGSWGANVNVKIPITTTTGVSCLTVVRALLDAGVDVNVTAMMTDAQVAGLIEILGVDDDVIVSVFAGRIADAGIDPVPVMTRYVEWLAQLPKAQLLWASPREVLNIVQAGNCGCEIITVTPELLRKLDLIGKDLTTFSLETVRMFYDDALSAGLDIA